MQVTSGQLFYNLLFKSLDIFTFRILCSTKNVILAWSSLTLRPSWVQSSFQVQSKIPIILHTRKRRSTLASWGLMPNRRRRNSRTQINTRELTSKTSISISNPTALSFLNFLWKNHCRLEAFGLKGSPPKSSMQPGKAMLRSFPK